MNVFVKPDEQRLSLLRLCHGEKMKVKPTIKTFMGGLLQNHICNMSPMLVYQEVGIFQDINRQKHKHIFSSNDMSTMDEYAIRRYVATRQQANHASTENVENLQRKTHHKMTGAHHSIQSAVCPRFFELCRHIPMIYSNLLSPQ